MNKKGLTGIVIGIIVGIILLGTVTAIVASPDIRNSITSAITTTKMCGDAPYDPKCTCLTGFDKIKLKILVPKWICEKKDKLINIDVIGWEERAKSVAKQKLNEVFPECDMKNCNRENTEFIVSSGVLDKERRVILIDCKDSQVGFRFSEIVYDIIEGAVVTSACSNYDDIVQEVVTENPIEINFDKPREVQDKGYILTKASFRSSCGDIDNGKGITTVFAPRGNIGEWVLWRGGFSSITLENGRVKFTQSGQIIKSTSMNLISGSCIIKESTEDFATIFCDTKCSHTSFSDGIHVAGYHTNTFWNNLPKCFDTERIVYGEGDRIVCNPIKTMYKCVNGEWIVVSTSSTSSSSICPAS